MSPKYKADELILLQSFHTRIPSPGGIDDPAISEQMPFFTEAMHTTNFLRLSSYAACVFMVELALQCFDHSRMAETNDGNKGFWDRHYSLVKNIEERNAIMSAYFSTSALTQDPIALSRHLNMCSLEIQLHEAAIREISRQALPPGMASESRTRSLAAAERIFGAVQLNWREQQSEVR